MLCEQVLGKLHDLIYRKTIEYVDIEWHEAFKKIHKKITDKGTEVGIRMDDSILARGLYQDDVIYADNEKLVVVNTPPCEVIRVSLTPGHEKMSAKVCYEIGNRHAPLFWERMIRLSRSIMSQCLLCFRNPWSSGRERSVEAGL